MGNNAMAILTLVIAVVGLVISVVSLTWQIVQHFLSGSRVAVQLLWGAFGSGGVAVGPVRGSLEPLAEQGFSQFVVAVRGRNVGRLPVDVKSFDVQLKKGMAYSLPGWHVNPAVPYRLEAGSEVTFYLPLSDVAAFIHASEAIQPYDGFLRGRIGLGTGSEPASRWTRFPRP